MARGQSKKAKSWERLMMLMINGGSFSKDDILNKIDYDFGYRLSSLVHEIKLHGGVIKTHKNGRNVTGYELMNPEDIRKYLTKRGLTIMQFDTVDSLADLGAKQIVSDKIDELVVEEITE